MPYTNKEKQRRYKAKMYKAGFKHIMIWVMRKEPKKIEMSQTIFIRRIKKLLNGMNPENLEKTYNLIIKILLAKKKEEKLKKKT